MLKFVYDISSNSLKQLFQAFIRDIYVNLESHFKYLLQPRVGILSRVMAKINNHQQCVWVRVGSSKPIARRQTCFATEMSWPPWPTWAIGTVQISFFSLPRYAYHYLSLFIYFYTGWVCKPSWVWLSLYLPWSTFCGSFYVFHFFILSLSLFLSFDLVMSICIIPVLP